MPESCLRPKITLTDHREHPARCIGRHRASLWAAITKCRPDIVDELRQPPENQRWLPLRELEDGDEFTSHPEAKPADPDTGGQPAKTLASSAKTTFRPSSSCKWQVEPACSSVGGLDDGEVARRLAPPGRLEDFLDLPIAVFEAKSSGNGLAIDWWFLRIDFFSSEDFFPGSPLFRAA